MGESQHGVIFLSAFRLVQTMSCLQKTSSTFISFTVWKQTLPGLRMANQLWKVISLLFLSKWAHPAYAGHQPALERGQSFLQVSPPLPPGRSSSQEHWWKDCHHRHRKAGGQDYPLRQPPGGQKVYFITTAEKDCLFYSMMRFLPWSHRLCCSVRTLSSENTSSWFRSSPPPEP